MDNNIVKSDRIALLKSLEPNSVGMVIVDPPEAPSEVYTALEMGYDDADTPPLIEQLADYLAPLVTQTVRVLTPGGAAVVMGSPLMLSAWEIASGRKKDALRYSAEFVVLWRGSSVGRFHNERRTPRVESLHTNIRWYVKRGLHLSAPTREVDVPSDVVTCERVPVDERHAPTQRPVELFTYLVSLLTEPKALVVDPYCGTGSALVAAEIANRRWYGGDTDIRMVRLARKRLADIDSEEAELRRFFLWTPKRLVELYS